MASPAVLDMKEEDQDKMLQLLERQMQLQFGEVLTSTKKAVRDTSDNNASSTNIHEDSAVTAISEDAENRDGSSHFRLFSTGTVSAADFTDFPRVRLQSPTDLLLLHGRSLNRILAVEDEPKATVKERRRQIKAATVDGNWILETSNPSYWSPFPQPSRKLLQKPLLAPSKTRKPLPQVGILYSPKPKSSLHSLKIQQNSEDQGKVRLKPYPDLSKERIEDRLAKKMKKRQAAALSLVNKNEIQKDQLVNASEKKMQTKTLRKKRKSKKKRMHEKQSKIA